MDESQPQCPLTKQEKQQQQQQREHQQKQLFSIEPETRYAQSPKNVPQGLFFIYFLSSSYEEIYT